GERSAGDADGSRAVEVVVDGHDSAGDGDRAVIDRFALHLKRSARLIDNPRAGGVDVDDKLADVNESAGLGELSQQGILLTDDQSAGLERADAAHVVKASLPRRWRGTANDPAAASDRHRLRLNQPDGMKK